MSQSVFNATNPFTAFAADSVNPFAAGARRAALDVPEDAEPGTYTFAMVKNGPDVPAHEVELPSTNAVEVTVMWGSSVLHVAHVAPERGFAVGEEAGKGRACQLFLPEEKIGTTRLPLVLGGARLVIPRDATGFVELPGQARMSLEQARTIAEPCVELNGAHALALPRGARARIELGGFAFQVAAVAAGKPVQRGLGASFDSTIASFFGTSLLSCAAVIAAMAYFVPPLGITEDESAQREQAQLIQQYLAASAEREQLQKDEPAAEETGGDEGGTGQRAPGEEGEMGNPIAKQTGGRWANKGPKDNMDPHLAKDLTRAEVENFGMIGLLNTGIAADPNAPTAPFGRDTSLGNDPESAQGAMWGDEIGEHRGLGGIGLTGVGSGGGCELGCQGVGLGYIGTYGHGSGLGPGQGFGNHAGRLAKGYKPKGPPAVRVGPTSVSGKLPPEVIQRIVRQNYGRFRMCYEQGLMRNPNLEGRVSIRFVIGRDGAVSNVGGGASDLPDSGVVSCVLSAFYGLSFPEPDGGVVTVVYPIMFAPG